MNKDEANLLFDISIKMYNSYYEQKGMYDRDCSLGYSEALADLQRIVIFKLCEQELE